MTHAEFEHFPHGGGLLRVFEEGTAASDDPFVKAVAFRWHDAEHTTIEITGVSQHNLPTPSEWRAMAAAAKAAGIRWTFRRASGARPGNRKVR